MHQYVVLSGDVTLTAGTAKVILSVITPATRRAKILEVKLGLQSVTATDVPGLIELVQYDTDGTGTAATPVAVDRADPAALCTSKSNYTVAPTGNITVLDSFKLTPIGGLLFYQIPFGEQPALLAGRVLGLRCTFPEAQTVHATLKFQE